MKSSRYIGISFFQGNLQLAEVEHGKKPTVLVLGERQTSVDFTNTSANLSADHPQLFTFVYELEDLMKESKASSKQISFALPTDPLFINVIPVDATLKGTELSSALQWELEQYYPDTPFKDFIVDSHTLPLGDQDTKQMFVVAVRRGIVGFLKKATAELRLQMKLIDIDHFSTEKSLRFNYPEWQKETIALFGVRNGRIDASFVLEGEMADYRSFVTLSEADIPKAISTYLKFLKQKDGIKQPGKILLHGTGVPKEIIPQIKRETNTDTISLDAIRKLSPSKKLQESFAKESSRFAAAIGLALREA